MTIKAGSLYTNDIFFGFILLDYQCDQPLKSWYYFGSILVDYQCDQPLKSWYYFGSILVDYQTGLGEKYLVTGDWSQSVYFVL